MGRSRERDYRDRDGDRDSYRDRDNGRDSRDSYRDSRDYNRDYRDRDRGRERNNDRDRYSSSQRDNDLKSRTSNDNEGDSSKYKSSSSSRKSNNKRDRSLSRSSSSSSSSSSRSRSRTRSKDKRKSKRKEKELLKQRETPEEKRQRRIDKKIAKDEKRREREEAEKLGYSNSMNPFGDENLTDRFVWKAKREKLIKQGMSTEEYQKKFERNKRQEIQEELEKAKKRREEREAEQELWEAEKERLQRLKDSENNDELERKEEEFHLDQARKKSQLRLTEGRPQPIDILYRCLNMDIKLKYESYYYDPTVMIKALDRNRLETLENDILNFQYVDRDNDEYWASSLILVRNELKQQQQQQQQQEKSNNESNGREGVHQSLTKDVYKVLQGKDYKQLETLQGQINEKLKSGDAINVEYWEGLLEYLIIYKANALIRETFTKNLNTKLSDMETEQFIQNIKNNMFFKDQPKPTTTTTTTTTTSNSGDKQDNEQEDEHKLRFTSHVMQSADSDDEGKEQEERENQMVRKESEKWMDEETEENFDLEISLESKRYAWHDKYRPRKPKFFNRVHSGYDWSKYNQTHYDHDNPPPKIVQGYKFNIFYPDLIDKTKAPQYFVERPNDGSDTVILRFHAGPPYEDVAFKIVNREWEYNHRRGYKCVFDKGVLNLWFNFKRYRYRR